MDKSAIVEKPQWTEPSGDPEPPSSRAPGGLGRLSARMPARLRRKLGDNALAYVFLLAGIACFALFSWYPLVRGVILSFQQVNLHNANVKDALPGRLLGAPQPEPVGEREPLPHSIEQPTLFPSSIFVPGAS